MFQPKFIIVIGASAGGTSALSELVTQLNEEIDAAIFIVLHLSDMAIGELLVHRLQQVTPLICSLATDNMIKSLSISIILLLLAIFVRI